MALFTDGNISTLENLSGEDTGILDLANTEGIDLSVKLALAHDELAIELGSWLARSQAASPWDQPTLQNIVVTPPLRMWHTFYTLALVYRDAYYNQLNDRYLAKWNEYKEQMKWASGMLFQAGAGMVWDPIPVAGPPALAAVAGTQPATTYFVAIAWLNARGEEGGGRGGIADNACPARGPSDAAEYTGQRQDLEHLCRPGDGDVDAAEFGAARLG